MLTKDDDFTELDIKEEDQFKNDDLHIPVSTEVLSMEEFFGTNVVEPKDIQLKVREMLVPMALNTYKTLLHSSDLKVKKSAADAIMEIAGLKGGGSFNAPTGGMGGVTFNLLGEEKKNLMGAFGEIIKGELIEEAEVVK